MDTNHSLILLSYLNSNCLFRKPTRISLNGGLKLTSQSSSDLYMTQLSRAIIAGIESGNGGTRNSIVQNLFLRIHLVSGIEK